MARSRRTLLMLFVTALAVASCSSDSESASEDTAMGTLPPGATERTTGDSCSDRTGDMFSDAFAEEGTLDEPAGIDITEAAAEVDEEGSGDLHVRFEVAGDVRETDGPMFTVFQGPPAELTSWELRLVGGGEWDVELLTYEPDQRAEATAVVQELDVAVELSDDGSVISVDVPAGSFPPAASLIWSFGSSARVGEGVVFDECTNLDGS